MSYCGSSRLIPTQQRANSGSSILNAPGGPLCSTAEVTNGRTVLLNTTLNRQWQQNFDSAALQKYQLNTKLYTNGSSTLTQLRNRRKEVQKCSSEHEKTEVEVISAF
jgi:hypothetical protein